MFSWFVPFFINRKTSRVLSVRVEKSVSRRRGTWTLVKIVRVQKYLGVSCWTLVVEPEDREVYLPLTFSKSIKNRVIDKNIQRLPKRTGYKFPVWPLLDFSMSKKQDRSFGQEHSLQGSGPGTFFGSARAWISSSPICRTGSRVRNSTFKIKDRERFLGRCAVEVVRGD